MSIKIMSWVFDYSPYQGKARLVHLVLADHANDEGMCWPSQSVIARRAGCSVETVRITVKQMITDGYLQIVEPSSREGSAHTYQLIVPGWKPQSPENLGSPSGKGRGPQVSRETSPNPPPSNHQEPPIEPTRCPYCKKPIHLGKAHDCPVMNQRIR